MRARGTHASLGRPRSALIFEGVALMRLKARHLRSAAADAAVRASPTGAGLVRPP